MLVLPGQAANTEIRGEEIGTPDLALYYSPSELYHMANKFGELGRTDYIKARFTFDLIWPLVYTFTLVTTISWLLSRAVTLTSKWRHANLLPFIVLILDYLENISTSLVMFRYPARADLIASLAPFFTFFKWVTLVISFIMLLVAIILWIFTRYRYKKNLGKTG